MDENYEELFQRIREKCRQQRWHGPDISNPWKIVERERLRQQEAKEAFERLCKENPSRKGRVVVSMGSATVYWYDRNGKQYAINADTDLESFPLQTDFEYAPATEEELAAAEKQLGYPLPSLLRALYANVANGGFGPGYGLEGIRGYVRPDRLIALCHWGCGIFSHLDCRSGRVFWGEAGPDAYALRGQAASLYEWLDLWADGEDFWSRMYPEGQEDELTRYNFL